MPCIAAWDLCIIHPTTINRERVISLWTKIWQNSTFLIRHSVLSLSLFSRDLSESLAKVVFQFNFLLIHTGFSPSRNTGWRIPCSGFWFAVFGLFQDTSTQPQIETNWFLLVQFQFRQSHQTKRAETPSHPSLGSVLGRGENWMRSWISTPYRFVLAKTFSSCCSSI